MVIIIRFLHFYVYNPAGCQAALQVKDAGATLQILDNALRHVFYDDKLFIPKENPQNFLIKSQAFSHLDKECIIHGIEAHSISTYFCIVAHYIIYLRAVFCGESDFLRRIFFPSKLSTSILHQFRGIHKL